MTEPQPSPALRSDGLVTPHPDRLALDHPLYAEIMASHAEACDAGEMGYVDPASGLFAMTAIHLASRSCCERGCRHCPWVRAPDSAGESR